MDAVEADPVRGPAATGKAGPVVAGGWDGRCSVLRWAGDDDANRRTQLTGGRQDGGTGLDVHDCQMLEADRMPT